MVALYQTSTLASWTSIAYTSYWGCATWLGDPYGGEASSGGHASRVETRAGSFDGFRCDLPGLGRGNAALASAFFPIYIVLTAWVIMSLFIGVISMGMFQAFEELKEEKKQKQYKERLAGTAGVAGKEAAAVVRPKKRGSIAAVVSFARRGSGNTGSDASAPRRNSSMVGACRPTNDQLMTVAHFFLYFFS